MVREIHMPRGFVALVDDEDYEEMSQYFWGVDTHGYARRNYRKENGKYSMTAMHRQIMEAEEGDIVDHINRNTLDNRKSNLRFVTKGENNVNAPRRKDNTSGYKGVSKRGGQNRKKEWCAKITKDGKTYSLGYHETPEQAARAYNTKAKELYGGYAELNKIEGED